MKKIVFCLIFALPILIQAQDSTVKTEIGAKLDAWHRAAANANFDDFFQMMAKDAVFIGTDANEHWTKTEFMAYAKPHFDKGKAWSFSVLNRHIYLSEGHKIAWFDELLDTQMGVCRGSGVLKNTASGWKIDHYVLSTTIPNSKISKVKKVKKSEDAEIINELDP